uniref:Double zinc ribbon and ankyrin repeat domains 1 n=1 Tax=Zosterops lateralis melanops TaxID=1220523 RepID=A0A8D2NII0_ZOSLA
MTAGSVSVPQIIPLRIPPPGKAQREIDTNTLIEIKSDTPGASIYYTLDGSKPELIKKPGYRACNTLEYKGPITLPVGKIMVKAMAVTKDYRESSVMTKVFVVEYQQPNILFSVEDDEKNFLKDMATQVSFRTCNPLCEYKMLYILYYLETNSSAVTSQKSLTSTQVSRIQSKTDFLKCAHCSAPRLSEPLAHFCQKCGSPMPPVPVQRFPLPEGKQMAPCLECRHLVPMNTPTCIICESPIAPQLQPQNNICIKGKVICQVCGTGNPLHHKHCATCESKLPEVQMPVFGGDSCPPLQGQQRKTAQCSKCNGVNQSDARFCAWCGAKARAPALSGDKPAAASLQQCHCNFSLQNSCQSANTVIIKILAYSIEDCVWKNEGLRRANPTSVSDPRAQVAWQTCPVSLHKSRAELTEDKGTQTVGLFYPSSKLLEKKELELISQKEKVEKMNDRKPLLTAISPGKGYWRKQLDHVCAHVRSYAQNNLEFRTLIGEPQMGKVGRKSRQLLDELGQTGKGRITFIEQLLSDGADPNSVSEEERPALTVAVLNKHTGAISPLVQKGADIDQQSGPAVTCNELSNLNVFCIYSCNANVQKKNAAGHSALDLAVAAGDNKVISLFQVSLDREH